MGQFGFGLVVFVVLAVLPMVLALVLNARDPASRARADAGEAER